MEQIILEKINLEEMVTELLKGNNIYFRNDKNFIIVDSIDISCSGIIVRYDDNYNTEEFDANDLKSNHLEFFKKIEQGGKNEYIKNKKNS